MRMLIKKLFFPLLLSFFLVTSAWADYGPDVMTGGTASADNEYDVYTADKAVDDVDSGLGWGSIEAFPHWWKYDLGAGVTKTVRQLRINPYGDGNGNYVKNFILYGSNNDVDWTSIYTGQHADDHAWETYTFSNATAFRYYRISMSDNWWHVAGVENYCFITELEMMEFVAGEASQVIGGEIIY